MITTKKRGRVTLYYWPSEEKGKTYLLKGKKTVLQKAEFLFRHIKKNTGTPLAHLHLRPFKDGYAIFDREGRRLFYGHAPGKRGGRGKVGWMPGPTVVAIETMHTMRDFDA
jgi:hypothetical protein